MGLQNGDYIVSLDHEKIENFLYILPDIILNDRKTIQVKRNGMIQDIDIPEGTIATLIKSRSRVFSPRFPFAPLVIEDFMKDSPAREAGVQIGDELVEVDGIEFVYYDEFQDYLNNVEEEQEIDLMFKRGSEQVHIPLLLNDLGMIGIVRVNQEYFEFRHLKYGFFESIPAGINKGVKTLGDYLKQFKLIFSRGTKAYESLGGFITIGSIFPPVWDWQSFWNLTAFLSIILAFMNILPIPALDGGHVLFLLYEIVTGRKPGDKFMEYAQLTGMLLLVALLLFANGNDVIRLFKN
jgi:regulator of sigma E protease